jgi:alpha-amylase
MKITSFILVMVVTLSLWSCTTNESSQNNGEEVSAWPNAVTYEIFVRSFADSDGDGIGDIQGMTQQLPYLQELGIKAVWLMPISPSPSYHKYDVTDYYGIHPDYGTMDDFKEFVTKAHEHDIKVVIDLVVNHTARDHPWFQAAMSDKNSPYRDWYVWAKKEDVQDELDKKEVHFDSDNINQWHEAPGNDELYYGYFWGGMPDLNFDNPAVKEEIFKIGRFWLSEVGVDGFRLDAARHIFPDDRPEDNHNWWVEFKTEMQKVKPDVYTIGEIWANMETTAPYAPGFSSFFNFDLAYSILESVKQGKNVAMSISHTSYEAREGVSLVDGLAYSRKTFKKLNPDFYDATFLTNHDQPRLMNVLEGNVESYKLAAAILLSLPGTPYIYYGEEIGMWGPKPDPEIREPFLWNTKAQDQYRTTWTPSKNTNDETVTPLALQIEDPHSLYNHYKTLIALRNQHPVLAVGEIEPVASFNDAFLIYKRVYEGESWMIIHHLAEQAVETEVGSFGTFSELVWTHGVTLTNESLQFAPKSTMITKL